MRKETIKMRAAINKIMNKKTVKLMKQRSNSLKKIDTPLTRLTKREKTLIIKIRNKR